MRERPPKLPFSATHGVEASRVLTWPEKAVWLKDHALDLGPEGSWISAANLAERLGLSPETVETYRRRFEVVGLHFKIKRPGARSPGWVSTLPEGCVPRSQRPTPEVVMECARRLDWLLEKAGWRSGVATSERPQSEWTYFVQVGPDGPVKIGRADDVERRVREIQAGHTEDVRLLGVTKQVSERAAHEQWAGYRIRGEWFRSSDGLLTWIAEVADTGPPRVRTNDRRAAGQPSARAADGGTALGGKGGSSILASVRSTTLQPPDGQEDGVGTRAPEAEDGGPELRPREEVEAEGWNRIRELKSGRQKLDPDTRKAFENWLAKLPPERQEQERRRAYGL